MSEIILADPPGYVGTTRGNVYLPFVATEPVSPVEAFYRLLTRDQRQQRPVLGTCAMLEAAAAWKAADIVAHGYWTHQASTGEWPNTTARRFGCNLPTEYGGDWNGCESLVAGSSNALIVFNALAESPGHSVHLFGLNEFFRQQTHVGVALATGGKYGWVWCVMIARCA